MSEKKKHRPMNENELWKLKKGFILASGSPNRRALLEEVRLFPEEIVSPQIDENPLENETPTRYVKRIAIEKAQEVAKMYPNRCIVAADTVLAVGHRIIRKAFSEKEARQNLLLLSGRRHRVLTGLCIITPDGKIISKINTSIVILKKLDETDIQIILNSQEWKDVAGYKIEGVLLAFVKQIIGSYSGIVGLPIYETSCILRGILS